MRTLAATEARALLAALEESGKRLTALFRLLVDSGAQVGETLALTWDDIHLDRGTIRIRRALTDVECTGLPVFGEPKTAKSRRTVTLAPGTVAAIKSHRARQLEERLQARGSDAGYNRVFATPIRMAVGEWQPRRELARGLRAAELPPMRLHDLRHTSATLLLASGANPREVADRLGHSNVAITLTRYSHVTESMEAGAAARIARALDG